MAGIVFNHQEVSESGPGLLSSAFSDISGVDAALSPAFNTWLHDGEHKLRQFRSA